MANNIAHLLLLHYRFYLLAMQKETLQLLPINQIWELLFDRSPPAPARSFCEAIFIKIIAKRGNIIYRWSGYVTVNTHDVEH